MSDSHSNDCDCPYCERGKRIAELEAENARLMAHIAEGPCIRCERDEARAENARLEADERAACAKVAHDVAQSYECDPEGSDPESSAYARVALDVETRIRARGAK